MIDPAALGTLRIGLDRIRRESALTDGPTDARTGRATRTHRDRGLPRLVAAARRRLADTLSAPGGYDAESASL